MSLLTNQIKYREYIIPAPNVDWFKYYIYADKSKWDGSVKKLYVEINHRDGRKHRQEIAYDTLLRIKGQTQVIHYLFKYGIAENEIDTIRSDSFINNIVTNRFYKLRMEVCQKFRMAYGPDITHWRDEGPELRLEYLFFGLKMWELYYDERRPNGFGTNKDWLFSLIPSKIPVSDTAFSWAKKYISSDHHYSEWKNRFGYFDINGYGTTFEDGGFIPCWV